MLIEKMKLLNYRNFKDCEIILNHGINIFYGDNAQGKTNFIEAIHLCATGRSFRTSADKELILFSQKEAHLQVLIENNLIKDKIDVHLFKDEKKFISVNSIMVKKLGELFGVLFIVVFSPEDLQLIKAGPADRRRFMDTELCQLSKIYYYELKQYYHILKQRNNLLKMIQKNIELKETLFPWDEQLVFHGIKIMNYRKEFIEKVNFYAKKVHANLSEDKEELNIIYKPNISEADFLLKLKKMINKDILTGSTSYGIHRDDLIFYINNNDARIFGSQGQQRTVCLSVKVAELELIRNEKNINPIFLLDDVLSELDEKRQKYLLNTISGIQTFITATGMYDIAKYLSSDYKIYYVRNGTIS